MRTLSTAALVAIVALFAPLARAEKRQIAKADTPFVREPPSANPEAQPPRTHGFELGLRLGFGLPMGNAIGTAKLGEGLGVSGAIPIWVDAGYRVNPHFYAGAYFEYAFGVGSPGGRGSVCTDAPDARCSFSGIRTGLNLHFHLLPGAVIDPWIGVGAGVEVARTSLYIYNQPQSFSLVGLELANLQLGGDIKVSRLLSVGPVASLSFARYSSGSSSGAYESRSLDIPSEDRATHHWLTLGVRGRFDL